MFIRMVRWWLTLKPIERSGRIYECLGFAALDKVLAGIFGEAPIQRHSPGREMSRAVLLSKLFKGQYAEIVNVMCSLIFITLAVFCWIRGYTFLAWFSIFGIAIAHIVVVPIERYKRALMMEWRQHPESLTDDPLPYPPVRTLEQLRSPFYRPRRFESEEFYAKVGAGVFRTFVFWLTKLAESIADDETRPYMPNVLTSMKMEAVDNFEATTRQSEFIHWIGVFQHLPFLIVFAMHLDWLGLAYIIYIKFLNIGAILLQRQHRARLYPLLERRAIKAAAKQS